MKVAVLLALAVGSAWAQPREGRSRELSVSGAYQNISLGTGSSSSGAFLISPRMGFYVIEGLELEPEVLLLFSSGADAVYMLNGNVSYNFISGGKSAPFLLLGYGIANTVPIFNIPSLRVDFGVRVLNAGGGIKVYVHENVAVRIEYRYQSFSGEGKTAYYGPYSYGEQVDARIHTVQFGFSVLL